MDKIFLNTRDEVTMLDVEKIMYFEADGNYTRFRYDNGKEMMVSFGISQMEKILASAIGLMKEKPFCRLGRSLIINQRYLMHLSTLNQKILLMGESGYTHQLTVPKATLKAYKELLTKNMKK